MQRVSQMSIVPDLIGQIEPRVDLRVAVKGGYIEPGSYINPNQVCKYRLLILLSNVVT